MLGHYSFGSTAADRLEVDETTRHCYEQKVGAWMAVEAIVRQLDIEKTAHAVAKLSSESGSDKHPKGSVELDADIDNDVFEENCFSDLSDPEDFDEENAEGTTSEIAAAAAAKDPVVVVVVVEPPAKPSRVNKSSTDSGNVADEDVQKTSEDDEDAVEVVECSDEQKGGLALEITEDCFAEPEGEVTDGITETGRTDEAGGMSTVLSSNKSTPTTSSYETVANDFTTELVDGGEEQQTIILVDDEHEYVAAAMPQQQQHRHASVIITNASIDIVNVAAAGQDGEGDEVALTPLQEEISALETLETLQEPKSACVSPASSGGGVYSVSFL